MYAVKEYDGYLTVEFDHHPDLLELETAIAAEFTHPHYADTNDIWIFNDNLPDIGMEHFQDLESLIRTLFPEKAAHRKTAIVVSSGLGRAMGELWKSFTTLPYEVRVFASLDDAKIWVCSSDK